MTYLTGFLLCGSIEGIGSQGFPQLLVNPLPELLLKYIPGQFSFGICATLAGLDSSVNHTLNYAIQNPDGEEMLRGQETTIPGSPASAKQASSGGVVFMNSFSNLDIPVEGKYKIQFVVDGDKVAEHEFSVVKGA